MEQWQQQYILDNLPQLIRNTNCDDMLIAELRSKRILSDIEKAALEATSNKLERSGKLYDIVPTRADSYEILITVLNNLCQSGAAKLLIKGRSGPTHQRPNVTLTVDHNDHGHGGTSSSTNKDRVDFTPENRTKLNVVVQGSRSPIEFADDDYKLPKHGKGYALIINITEFKTKTDGHFHYRHGAEVDTEYMNALLAQLGYGVTKLTGNISLPELKAILKVFKEKLIREDALSCVVFVGSHGVYNKIYTSDHNSMTWFDIVYNFDSLNCDKLIGRPKLFIFQACQEFESDAGIDMMPGATASELLKLNIDDAVVCLSTTPGTLSRRTEVGTWFIYCLTKVLMENSHEKDFNDMFGKVNQTTQDMMRMIRANTTQGQLPTLWNLGLRKLYFNV